MTLEVDGLTHRYGDEPAVDGVSLSAAEGELLALLGPSGCGKTTVVQTVAGHFQPTGGRVRLRGTDVTDSPPETRRVGLVFQEPTLYPHMTVGENVAYGLKARGVGPEERAATVDEYLGLVGLGDRRDSSPPELSGGQRRRVELARALAPEPDVLLLDEPLSALDRQLRTELREEVARIQRETGVTTLYVTHDQETAMALADRLVVMNDGRVSGTGDPRTLYESPPTPFVASFLGRSTAVSGRLVAMGPPRVAVGGREISADAAAGEWEVGDIVTCHVRPRALKLRQGGEADPERSLHGEVAAVADAGHHYDVSVRVASDEELVVECATAPPAVGEPVAVELPDRGVTLFGPGFEPSTAASAGSGPATKNED